MSQQLDVRECPHPNPLPEGERTRRAYQATLSLIALAAIGVVLLATRWGIGTSGDSARYIRSARHVLGREAQVETGIENPAEQAHFPPMYSTVLALMSLGGAEPLNAARWLHALLLAANAIIAAEMVRRFTGSRGAAVFTAAVAAFSYPSIFIHTVALSEPLFVCFAMLSLGLVVSYVRRPRRATLIGAALLAGAGVLTRYAGWALLPAGFVALLLLSRASMKRRLADTAVFGVIACALPLAWSVRNAIVLGSATNRVIAWHPIGYIHVRDAARVAWSWLASDSVIHSAATIAVALLAIAVAVTPALLTRRRDAQDGGTLPAVMLFFALSFAVLLAVSISFVDAHTPIDLRVLSPVYAAWVVLAGCLLAEISGRESAAAHVTAWTIAGMLALWSVGRATLLVHAHCSDGSGFAHRIWRDSPVIAAAKDLVPAEKWIYTNGPGAVYLLTGRPVIITVPSKYSASSRQINPDYEEQMAKMRDDLQSGRAYLVWLRRFEKNRWYYPDVNVVKEQFELNMVAHRSDGNIWNWVPPEQRDRSGRTKAERKAAEAAKRRLD